MKKIILLGVLLVSSTMLVTAQTATRPTVAKPAGIKNNVDTIARVKQPVKKTVAAPAPANPSTPPPTAPPPAPSSSVVQYKLASVRVKIFTGRDNKESPSEVYTKFSLPDQVGSSYCAFAQWNQQNEMPVNSEIEVGLNKYANANLSLISTKLTMSNPEELRTGGNDILLSDIQQHGARLMIKYYPHLFTDAWRIENVTVTLEFKNNNGDPHPVYGTKILSFSNAKTFLNGFNERYLVCEIGKDLSAMVSYTRN